MSLTQLPSKRWRAQVYDARVGHNVSVSKILGGPGTFDTKREAKQARELARAKLAGLKPKTITVGEFHRRWTTDPLFARPKQSTDIHNRERTRAFAEKYADVPMDEVGDEIVGEWLAGGNRNGTVPSLRAMFNDAASPKGGRVVKHNPFSSLGLKKTRGNRDTNPPSEEMVWKLIGTARELSLPSFAAWLQVAAFTGLRPGELDALRWSAVDLEGGWLRVIEQFNAGSKTFTTPKNGLQRVVPITPPAREALLAAPRESEFCFNTLHRSHWTASARAYHWKSVRAGAGYKGTLYLATRHFCGAYMTNVLLLPAEDVAIALGHTDGGALVRQLYGHRDKRQALERVAAAYEAQAGRNVTPLKIVKEAG